MVTPDGQGLNWRWISVIAGVIISGLLVITGSLISKIATDKDSQLCGIQETLKNVKETMGEVKVNLAELKSNQNWTMTEMRRVAEELRVHEEGQKKAIK